jgi:hypothetical protein
MDRSLSVRVVSVDNIVVDMSSMTIDCGDDIAVAFGVDVSSVDRVGDNVFFFHLGVGFMHQISSGFSSSASSAEVSIVLRGNNMMAGSFFDSMVNGMIRFGVMTIMVFRMMMVSFSINRFHNIFRAVAFNVLSKSRFLVMVDGVLVVTGSLVSVVLVGVSMLSFSVDNDDGIGDCVSLWLGGESRFLVVVDGVLVVSSGLVSIVLMGVSVLSFSVNNDDGVGDSVSLWFRDSHGQTCTNK